jgi:SSS family transporter
MPQLALSSTMLLCFVLGYFVLLLGISYITSRKSSDNNTFFIANRNSKWYLVAFGMIGTAISGVTFISVPGKVGTTPGLEGADQFNYFQFVLGNMVGFILVAFVLLPLYYRLKLTSIYTYLGQRLGRISHLTGTYLFLISRTMGSAARLFLAANVLQKFIFNEMGVPFWLTVFICLLFIWSYTYKGGLKTIIWTDSLQTLFLVLAVVLSIVFIWNEIKATHAQGLMTAIENSGFNKMFFWDNFWGSGNHFWKQFFGGMFVTLAMVGLDQDLMQKNLSCKNINEAQKNMVSFTTVFVVINLLFLCVGALLYLYGNSKGVAIPVDEMTGKINRDLYYPEIALKYLGVFPAIIFMLGLTAATFATTDSALTALTTSYCVDVLHLDKRNDKASVTARHIVHIVFSVIMLVICLLLKRLNDKSIVDTIFTIAGITYGPLIGLFAFSMFTKRSLRNYLVPTVCAAAMIICTFLKLEGANFTTYKIGQELIILNGLLTFIGLLFISKPPQYKPIV